MAKFEVLYLDDHKTLLLKKQARDESGNRVTIQYEKNVVMSVGAYGHENLSVGDIIKLEGHLAEKARKNTRFFKEVTEVTEVKKKPKPRKKAA